MKIVSHTAYQFGEFVLARKYDRYTAYSSVTAYNHPVQSSHDIFSIFMDHFAVTAIERSLDLKIWLWGDKFWVSPHPPHRSLRGNGPP